MTLFIVFFFTKLNIIHSFYWNKLHKCNEAENWKKISANSGHFEAENFKNKTLEHELE